MARRISMRSKVLATAGAWLVGFVIFFPILWMVLTSFKTELAAFSTPPSFLFFEWTSENYTTVEARSDYVHHALNSIIIAGGSTLIAILIAIPAAWAMAFAPTERTRSTLLWMLSTKFVPAAGVLVPTYLPLISAGQLDTRTALLLITPGQPAARLGCFIPISRRYRWKSWTSRRSTGHGRSSNWGLSCCRWRHPGSPRQRCWR